jgi:hypothetical protein
VTTYILYSTGSSAVAWARGFLLEVYAVHIPGWDPTAKERPSMVLTPDDPNEPPIALVWFAAAIMHEDVEHAFLQYLWPFHDLTLPVSVQTFGIENLAVTDVQLTKLNRGRRFLQAEIRRVSGRPVGTTYRDRDYYLDSYRALSRQLKRPARQGEFLQYLLQQGDHSVKRATLVRNLQSFNLWPWETFVAAAQRTDNRR